ncbi:hypothetical protein [Klebsiella sp. Kps]|uniref:hypothetical protein n=1 Tax=Klebsiella sp. Kps TaxID=2758579 RepID=UPI0021BD0DCC|nr:hypothetical protein [Klebsiella sp. Kps]
MTSKFSIDNRELLQRISSGEAIVGIDFGNLIVRELAAFRLSAMDSEPVAIIDQANLDYLRSGADADVWPPEREEMGDVLLYRHPQPAPVVPEEATPDSIEILASGRCRDNVVYQWDEDQRNAAADSWNACRAAMLEAAPQSPGSEPATVPGKWIPVSEQMPDCWCLTCRPVVLNDMRFVVCPDCGNKRCPRANDHRNACTGSNEPGQEGGAYPDTPQEVKP